jgi:hypothetical protein
MAINIPIVTAFSDAGIKAAESAFGKFGKTGVAVGAAFAAVSTAVVAGLGLSVKAAAEDQRSQELLEKQLYNTLAASEKTTKATEDFVGQMELATGVADNQLRVALGNLVRSTGDLTTAQDLLGLSLDISTATGKDLESVSIALGKASMGQMTALQKLGIPLDDDIKKTKDFSKIQEALDKQFSGASAAAADTFGGQLARLGTVWDNLTESIGYAIINNKYVKDAIGLLPDAADKAIKAFGNQGLGGALDVFLDNMGITGAYVKMWAASVVREYNQMAVRANNALQLLTLGLIQLVPGYRKAIKEVESNILNAGLQMQASQMFIDDLTDAMNLQEAQTKRNATESERWSQYAESMGVVAEVTTGKIEGLGGGAAKVDPKIKAMADRVKDAAEALDKQLNEALDNAKTGLKDAQSAFDDFGQSVSDGLKNAFSFKDAKDGGDETGKGFLAGLQDQVTGIQVYADDVATLLTMGLSQDSLQAVLDAGGESGAAIAAELIKGGANAIIKTNQLVESAKVAADFVGQLAANQWYGAGVSNAQSYLQGVEAAFAEAQKRLGAKGLKLPDIKGIGASFSESLAGPSVTPIQVSKPTPGYGGPGGGVTINVTGGISTSAEIGESVVNAIRAYNRAAGPANIAVG